MGILSLIKKLPVWHKRIGAYDKKHPGDLVDQGIVSGTDEDKRKKNNDLFPCAQIAEELVFQPKIVGDEDKHRGNDAIIQN